MAYTADNSPYVRYSPRRQRRHVRRLAELVLRLRRRAQGPGVHPAGPARRRAGVQEAGRRPARPRPADVRAATAARHRNRAQHRVPLPVRRPVADGRPARLAGRRRAGAGRLRTQHHRPVQGPGLPTVAGGQDPVLRLRGRAEQLGRLVAADGRAMGPGARDPGHLGRRLGHERGADRHLLPVLDRPRLGAAGAPHTAARRHLHPVGHGGRPDHPLLQPLQPPGRAGRGHQPRAVRRHERTRRPGRHLLLQQRHGRPHRAVGKRRKARPGRPPRQRDLHLGRLRVRVLQRARCEVLGSGVRGPLVGRAGGPGGDGRGAMGRQPDHTGGHARCRRRGRAVLRRRLLLRRRNRQ